MRVVEQSAERSRSIGALEGAGLDVHAAKFLDAEFARPATIAELVAAASTLALRGAGLYGGAHRHRAGQH